MAEHTHEEFAKKKELDQLWRGYLRAYNRVRGMFLVSLLLHIYTIVLLVLEIRR